MFDCKRFISSNTYTKILWTRPGDPPQAAYLEVPLALGVELLSAGHSLDELLYDHSIVDPGIRRINL